ncbi:MAG: CoA transferase [Dehalococcoidales bacterium]|nr:CoA transferase [Dehalococcoidales bacterium]
MLEHLRALDLTDEKGFLCGKILADLGVNVIKVEPPGGCPSRRRPPFWGNEPDPEKNIYWLTYNTNKKGITLDITSMRGKEIFRRLVKTADFVIESFAPGYLDSLGIGYVNLSKESPHLIWASITPFGQEGPYRDYRYEDIVVMGMSGTLYQTGDADGPPVHMSVPQAPLHAGADAAVGCMVAYYHRVKTGLGQHVDVSMQQSAAWFQANAVPVYELNGVILRRAGAFRAGTSSQVPQRQVWPCKDGYVFFNVIGGRTGAKTLSALTAWMDEEGMATDFLLSMDWDSFDMFKVSAEVMEKISRPVGEFFLRHTRRELLKGAVARGISIGPLFGMKDLLEDECLLARDFWTGLEHPELGGSIIYPRMFIRASLMDCSVRLPAPRIGEHNREIYGELGFSEAEMEKLREEGVI